MKFKFEIKEITSIRLFASICMKLTHWGRSDAKWMLHRTWGIHAHIMRWIIYDDFSGFRFIFSVFQFKKKEENIRVYRNHCIDWLLMYRCTELLKLNSGCVLHEIWAVSNKRTRRSRRGEGASSIGGRINKGRVVINSVRHVAEREAVGGRLTRRIINIFHTAFPAVFEFLKCEQQQQQQLLQWTRAKA